MLPERTVRMMLPKTGSPASLMRAMSASTPQKHTAATASTVSAAENALYH